MIAAEANLIRVIVPERLSWSFIVVKDNSLIYLKSIVAIQRPFVRVKRPVIACMGVIALSFVFTAINRAACEGGNGKASPAPDSYQSCLKAGGFVEGRGEARCKTQTGVTFSRPKENLGAACRDLCGDGICQEIVCMAVGCPCPESAERCPADCNEGLAGSQER